MIMRNGEQQRLVLAALIKLGRPARPSEVAPHAGMTNKQTSAALDNLRFRGEVFRSDSGGNGYLYRAAGVPELDLPRVHIQPGPLVPSIGTVVGMQGRAA